MVFQACTALMNLADEVDLEDYVNRPEKISAAVRSYTTTRHTDISHVEIYRKRPESEHRHWDQGLTMVCVLCMCVPVQDIAAICQEAGLQAVRKNRYVILSKDFDKAYKKHVNKADKEHLFYSM